jgi:hypothetical protein
LDSGAGAFVHGLEDEFHQVRSATIDSICELSSTSPVFAEKVCSNYLKEDASIFKKLFPLP